MLYKLDLGPETKYFRYCRNAISYVETLYLDVRVCGGIVYSEDVAIGTILPIYPEEDN